MLLEGLPELGYLAGELLALFRSSLQLGQSFAGLFVVVQRVGHEVLRLLALLQHREEMLLLQSHLEFQLFLEFPEQALTRFDGVARGLGELGEEIICLGWAGLDQLSNGGHMLLRKWVSKASLTLTTALLMVRTVVAVDRRLISGILRVMGSYDAVQHAVSTL